MSTTKFMTATGSNRELTVKRSNESSVQIRQYDADHESHRAKTFFLNPTDAPALALAILEAAGHVRDACSDNDADVAMEWLHSAIARQAKQSAEAKEQAELEAEALELANSAVLVVGNPPYPSIGHMSDTSLRKWLAVARKAREMAKEAPNA